jgi:hypothetical protein
VAAATQQDVGEGSISPAKERIALAGANWRLPVLNLPSGRARWYVQASPVENGQKRALGCQGVARCLRLKADGAGVDAHGLSSALHLRTLNLLFITEL